MTATLQKKLSLSKLDYFEVHLSLINCLFPKNAKMTPMQIKVLSAFMTLEGDISRDTFGTSGRKFVMQSLNISPASLSNYLGDLEKMKCIRRDNETKDIIILPLLMPNKNEQIYMFKLVNNEYRADTKDSGEREVQQRETRTSLQEAE